jgi:hypothetical protein
MQPSDICLGSITSSTEREEDKESLEQTQHSNIWWQTCWTSCQQNKMTECIRTLTCPGVVNVMRLLDFYILGYWRPHVIQCSQCKIGLCISVTCCIKHIKCMCLSYQWAWLPQFTSRQSNSIPCERSPISICSLFYNIHLCTICNTSLAYIAHSLWFMFGFAMHKYLSYRSYRVASHVIHIVAGVGLSLLF